MRDTWKRARSRMGAEAVMPKTSAAESANAPTARAIVPRRPIVAAIGPASGDPRMFPKKYAPKTSPSARPSAPRGVVVASCAERTGTAALPDQ